MAKPQIALQRIALYIRVSSDEQAERGDSIRDQKERGTKYIDDHQNMILQDTYIDDGVSGQKLDRDDFTRLIRNVKAGLVDLIIFTKLDRWFRSLRHYLNTQVILDKYNGAGGTERRSSCCRRVPKQGRAWRSYNRKGAARLHDSK